MTVIAMGILSALILAIGLLMAPGWHGAGLPVLVGTVGLVWALFLLANALRTRNADDNRKPPDEPDEPDEPDGDRAGR